MTIITEFAQTTPSTHRNRKNPLSIFFREHKELLQRLAGRCKTRIICCAAKLINYFQRWRDWKEPLYKSAWIYQPIRDIQEDLLGEHSVHVIRDAICLLERLGFLTKRKNQRAENWRNGQDRTYQYFLHTDHILAALDSVQNPTAAEQLPIPGIGRNPWNESESFCSPMSKKCDTHPSSFVKNSNSAHSSEREQESEQESVEGIYEYYSSVNLGNSDLNVGNSDLNVGNSDLTNGFVSMVSADAPPLTRFISAGEKVDFYHKLIELGKHKSGIKSPTAWANSILRAIEAGEPCEYLFEYRRGEPIGACEKREWEILPGRPYDQFVSYLKRKFLAAYQTPEQAVAQVFKALGDTNEAQALWEGYKRHLVNLKSDWDNQKALGVSAPYIPPEVLPEREVSLEEVGEAMQSLQQAANPCAIAAAQEQESLPSPTPNDTDILAQIERMKGYLQSQFTFLRGAARKWLEGNAEELIIVRDDSGEILDILLRNQSDDQAQEPTTDVQTQEPTTDVQTQEPTTDVQAQEPAQTQESGDRSQQTEFKIGDRVFVTPWPHTDRLGPYPIERIEGDFAKVEGFAKLISLSSLRLA